MRKLIYIFLLFVSHVAFGQADVWTIRPVTNTGANFNKQSNHMANTTFDFTLRIPRSTHFTLNGGKDTLGAIAYALDVHKMGVYRGSGVWDTLASGTIPLGNYVPYTGATNNVDLGSHNITSASAIIGGSTLNSSFWAVGPNATFSSGIQIPGTGNSGIRFNNAHTDNFDWTVYNGQENGSASLVFSYADNTNGIKFIGSDIFDQAGNKFLKNNGLSSNVILGDGTYAPYGGGGNGYTNGLTLTDSIRLGGPLSGTTFITTGSQSFGIINSLGATAGGEMFFNGHTSSEFGFTDGTNLSRIIFAATSPGVNMIVSDDSHIGLANGNDYSSSYATHPLALAQNGWVSSNFMDLTTNQSAAGNKRFTGQIQATGGVSPDGMGPINVTMPGNSTNYAYYGLTRSGITAAAMGLDNLNAFVIGTGPTRGNGATIDTPLFRLNTHNGNLMLYGTLSVPGTTTLANYYTTSGTPTGALGSSTVVGTGATLTINGTNQDGEITLVTGTGVSATGNAFTVTMNGFAYPTKCTPVISSQLDLGVSGPRLTVNSLTGTSWTLNGGGNQFTSSTTYKFTYHNGGY